MNSFGRTLIERWRLLALRRARLLVAALVFSSCLALFIAVRSYLSREVALPGTWVLDVALSGADYAQARTALKQLERRLVTRQVKLSIHGRVSSLEASRLGVRIDVDATFRRVLKEGRTGGLLARLSWWKARWFAPAIVRPVIRIDEGHFDHAVDELEEHAILDPAYQGGIIARANRVEPVYPRTGYEVDHGLAYTRVHEHLSAEASGRVVDLPTRLVEPRLTRAAVDDAVRRAERIVSAPVTLVREEFDTELRFSDTELRAALRSVVTSEPTPRLDLYFEPDLVARKLDDVRRKLEAPPRSATFRVDAKEKLHLVPAQSAVYLDANHVAQVLLAAASSEQRHAELPLELGEGPKLSTEEALGLGIKGLVSRFTTHHACCQPRVDNIHRIADLIDGVIVRPGEVFSVNALIGPRTLKNGFVPAPTIEEGEMVDTIGGGISQFATTLFNAVFHGGYDIVERQPHTYYFARYPMGHEATLSYPKPDLVFRNDSAAGLLIKTVYTSTSITVKLYGDNGGRKVTASVSPQHDVVQPETEYLPDPTLEPDEDKLREPGQIGWTVLVGRTITFADGTKKNEQRKVIYKARPRRVAVHPCRIPKGQPGHTGERCPEPEPDAGVELDEAGTVQPELDAGLEQQSD